MDKSKIKSISESLSHQDLFKEQSNNKVQEMFLFMGKD